MAVSHPVKAGALAIALAFAAAATSGATSAQDGPTLEGPTSDQPRAELHALDSLSFMSGCWEGPFESHGRRGTIEEHYTSRSRNLILGTTRYLVDGAAVQFEFSELRADSSGVWLRPYPAGEASEHAFRLTRAGGDEAVFEAPEHDFPKRIVYRLDPDGSLSARIDAGEGSEEASEWRMSRAACPE